MSSELLTNMDPKISAASQAVKLVSDGMVVGLGTGSTATIAIRMIGDLVKDGLNIKCVATSIQSERIAGELNIPLADFEAIETIDITIDGADEVDKDHNLIKGGGGALLREKLVAYNSKKFVVIVDESKLVEWLGKFPLPLEILEFGSELTLRQLQMLDCNPLLRFAGEKKYKTDNGNLIVDCDFYPIKNPATLEEQLMSIPGVLGTGLFLKEMVDTIFVGKNMSEN